MKRNVVLISALQESPIDERHWFVTVGPNCWGRGETAAEALKQCKTNAPHNYRGHYLTRVAPRLGFGIDPVDGTVSWSEQHDAKNCKVCTVGKGVQVLLQ